MTFGSFLINLSLVDFRITIRYVIDDRPIEFKFIS